MISRGQSIILGIIIGVVFFILYIRVVPFDDPIDSQSLKTIQLRTDLLESYNKDRFVAVSANEASSTISGAEKIPTSGNPIPISQIFETKKAHTSVNKIPEMKIVSNSNDFHVQKQNPSIGGNNRARDPSVFCPKMMKKYHIVPGSSWGTTTLEQQRMWSTLHCDQYLTTTKSGEDNSLKDILTTDQPSNTFENHEDNEEKNQTNEEESVQVGMPILPKANRVWCRNAREKYKVKPMKSWGNLPSNMIDDWKNKHCDLVFTANRMGKRPLSFCPNANSSSNNLDDHSNMVSTLPLIAIMAATTTRRIPNPSTSNLALFTLLLPSLLRSLDCGFRYEYVLGYDQGDPFYDSEEGLKEVKKWFYKNVRQPMKKNGIYLKLRLVKVNNTLKKPGPVFLEMARAAYSAGAAYFYRINDDTELTTGWPKVFVSTLDSLGMPYGVVGPYCDQGNQKILTHDFVHRTHMDIFEMNYYPPQLSDWWMDDWISWVYGQTRTFKARATTVIHHTGAHGQRYQVDPSHEMLLGDLVKHGRQKIRQYMLKQQVTEDILKRFDQDTAKPGFIHRDIPASVKEKLTQN